MCRCAEREDAFLCPGFLFVAPGAAECGVEPPIVERLLEPLGFHHLGVQRRSGIERIDAAPHPIFIDVHEQCQAEPLCRRIAELDHFPELPGRIHMQQWEGRLGGIEGLHRQMQHD